MSVRTPAPDPRAESATDPEEPASLLDDTWIQYKTDGDLACRERLILHYSPLVRFVAGRVGAGLPANVENADLASYGLFGLIDAIEKFDLSRGLKFETYALSRIRGAIIDELRGLDWVPRSVRAHSREVERAYAELEGELRRVPTDEEVADRLGIDIEKLRGIFAAVSFTHVAALDELLHSEEGGATLGDTVVDPRVENPEDVVDDSATKHILADAVDLLAEREKIVVALYYYEGFTLAEIGQVLGVSESRVSQLHTKSMLQLKSRLADLN